MPLQKGTCHQHILKYLGAYAKHQYQPLTLLIVALRVVLMIVLMASLMAIFILGLMTPLGFKSFESQSNESNSDGDRANLVMSMIYA